MQIRLSIGIKNYLHSYEFTSNLPADTDIFASESPSKHPHVKTNYLLKNFPDSRISSEPPIKPESLNPLWFIRYRVSGKDGVFYG